MQAFIGAMIYFVFMQILKGWLEVVANLHVHRKWWFQNTLQQDGLSVALFIEHRKWWCVDRKGVAVTDVTLIQITFDGSLDPDLHGMPKGKFRLAVINR